MNNQMLQINTAAGSLLKSRSSKEIERLQGELSLHQYRANLITVSAVIVGVVILISQLTNVSAKDQGSQDILSISIILSYLIIISQAYRFITTSNLNEKINNEQVLLSIYNQLDSLKSDYDLTVTINERSAFVLEKLIFLELAENNYERNLALNSFLSELNNIRKHFPTNYIDQSIYAFLSYLKAEHIDHTNVAVTDYFLNLIEGFKNIGKEES